MVSIADMGPRRSEESTRPLLPVLPVSTAAQRPHFCGRGGAGNFCQFRLLPSCWFFTLYTRLMIEIQTSRAQTRANMDPARQKAVFDTCDR